MPDTSGDQAWDISVGKLKTGFKNRIHDSPFETEEPANAVQLPSINQSNDELLYLSNEDEVGFVSY